MTTAMTLGSGSCRAGGRSADLASRPPRRWARQASGLRCTPRRRDLRPLGALLLTSLVLAACSGTPAVQGRDAPVTGVVVNGGTAYFAEQPETPPDYVFPLVSGQYFTVTNTADFQTLLYEPLYWFGDNGKYVDRLPALDRQRPALQRPRHGGDDHAEALPVVRRGDGERPRRRSSGSTCLRRTPTTGPPMCLAASPTTWSRRPPSRRPRSA